MTSSWNGCRGRLACLLLFCALVFPLASAANIVIDDVEQWRAIAAERDAQFTPADADGRYVYLVEFDEPGLLELHRQARGEGQRFDSQRSEIQAESARMADRHSGFLSQLGGVFGRSVQASHFFQVTHSGMALRLTEAEAGRVASLPGVASIERERQYFIDTFAGPEFIGADSVWAGVTTPSGLPYRGEGMVAAVLDTGTLPNHPSFINDPACGHGQGGTPNKLLSFVDCSATNAQGRCSGANPIDNNGHGTHVASTVAGNLVGPEANPAPNPPNGNTISGVAHCAHIRHYNVCPGSCPTADIQAAMNTVLLDGDVDTLNFSISGGTSPWNDNDRRKLDLVDAGIFVNASAGNTNANITNPVGAVNHRGPWVVSVAASTRPAGASGVISMTGPGTVSPSLQNIVMDRGSDSSNGLPFAGPIRFDPAQPAGNDGCSGFPAGFFNDAIALVQRGGCNFSQKINNAAAAGARVVVIWNNEPGGISMNTAGQVNVPAFSITQAQGQGFVDFINANPGATAAFSLQPGAGGDVLASFSLRGPTPGALQNLQKPDITAPGVGIYAADVTASGYGNKSGTSMSGPHLSGAAVLVRQMQPNWSPMEVGSALRMTAVKDGFKQTGNSAWDWDDVGSGRVDLTRAAFAGMVMNETRSNFLAANPAQGGDVRTLNLPAVRDVACTPVCTFTRTLRNTLDTPSTWSVSSEMRSGSFNISVSPQTFSFNGGLNETQTVTITVSPVGQQPLSFGMIDFVEANDQSPPLHFTVAAAGTGLDGELEGVVGFNFEGTVTGVTGNDTFASDLRMSITGPSGSNFAVGGFGNAAAPAAWSFDGEGSTNDGTYASSHPFAFAPGTDLEGDWQIQFGHTYGSGVPMNWGPIAIELTDPDGAVLAVLNVPSLSLDPGATSTVTVPVLEEPALEPQIAVSPSELSFTVPVNEFTGTGEFRVANSGGADLSFTLGACTGGIPSWLNLGALNGLLPPDTDLGIDVVVNTTNLAPGDYSAALCIQSNDPANATVEVDIDLVVLSAPARAVVSPAALSSVLSPGQSQVLELSLENAGGQNLIWSSAGIGVNGNPAGAGSSQTIFNSGPFVTSLGNGPNGADVSLTQSSLGMTTLGFLNGETTTGNFSTIADVFDVPAFTTWNVDTFSFFLYQTGSTTVSSFTGVYLQIWDGPPSDPASSLVFGDSVTNRLAFAGWTNAYRVSETTVNNQRPIMLVVANASGLELGPGQYWVAIHTEGSLASGPWLVPITRLGESTTGNAIQRQASGDWQALRDTGANTPQGMPFRVTGESTSSCQEADTVSWLSVSPEQGTVAPGELTGLAVTLNAEGLEEGSYSALICLETNDPQAPVVTIPVSMEVVDAAGAAAEVTPESLRFRSVEGSLDEGSLTIENVGTGTLVWSLDAADLGAMPGEGCLDRDADFSALEFSPESGSLLASESQVIGVELVIPGILLPGTSETLLCIYTNAEGQERIEVPIRFQSLTDDLFFDGFSSPE